MNSSLTFSRNLNCLKRAAASVLTGTLLAVSGLLMSFALPGPAGVLPAQAQSSCQIDFGILQKKRVAHIQALNRAVKKRKGKLDPITACPRLRNLAAVERKMVAYMKKNQAWCGIPDAPIAQMTKTSRQTGSTAARACKAVKAFRRAKAQARRQQRIQAQGIAAQRPKLPSGPL